MIVIHRKDKRLPEVYDQLPVRVWEEDVVTRVFSVKEGMGVRRFVIVYDKAFLRWKWEGFWFRKVTSHLIEAIGKDCVTTQHPDDYFSLLELEKDFHYQELNIDFERV